MVLQRVTHTQQYRVSISQFGKLGAGFGATLVFFQLLEKVNVNSCAQCGMMGLLGEAGESAKERSRLGQQIRASYFSPIDSQD